MKPTLGDMETYTNLQAHNKGRKNFFPGKELQQQQLLLLEERLSH
jgi:hypothetical protein